MTRIKIKYRPPGYRTAQLVLVPLIAAVLALGALASSCSPDKESSWNSRSTSKTLEAPKSQPSVPPASTIPAPRTTPATAPAILAAASGSAGRAPVKLALSSAPGTTSARSTSSPRTTTATSTGSEGSDQREQGNFSARTVPASESVQLTPCQRSAAACFASGGLGTLTDNLDGLAIDPVTGRFCFSFQEGCRR